MNPKLIGITGGIGSGKSTVSEIFKHLGYKIYNSDLRAKELIKEPVIKDKLVNAFGDKILKNDTLDKELLSEIIFENKSALKKINSIVHPEVKKDFKNWVKENSNNKILFKESALLIESETYKEEGNEIKTEDILDKDNTGFSVKLNNSAKLEKKDSETQIRNLEEKAKEFRIESEKKEKKVSIFSKIFSSNNTKPKIINKTEEDKQDIDPVLGRNNEDWDEIEKKQNNIKIKNEDIFHETNKQKMLLLK